ncbi:GH25 family lysozyme [Haloactinospora alba]|uniref:GH25 family lysozyme n=1 Tax=Haloactinospora alba TaxID=405555 RepID=UPI00114EAEB7|nr:GH25 family lysozyme [Haloactinospora alba]
MRQARFFVNNGGGWSGDGRTLPPALDIEHNPSGATCYGKSQPAMVDWIRAFSDEVKRLSGRYPVIYTTQSWWSQCTGDTGAFNRTNPLWIARWSSDPYPLPNWPSHTIWQYTSTGSVPGVSGNVDRNVFNGSRERLAAFAECSNENPC